MPNTKPADPRIEAALKEVDRAAFVRNDQASLVAGLSIPSTDSLRSILNALEIPPASNILHVGAGVGYLSAVLGKLARQVIAIEKNPSLAAAAASNMGALEMRNVLVRQGDGALGAPQEGPFDIIVISTPTIDDKSELFRQLANPGQLLCIEHAGAGKYLLAKYSNRGSGDCERSEHGHIDFIQDRSEILIELNSVDDNVLEQARQRAKENKTPVHDEVRKLVQDNDPEGRRSLSRQSGVQMASVDHLLRKADPTLFESCSRAFLDHHHLLPLYIQDNCLKIATSDPDASLLEIQQVFPGRLLEKVLVTPTDFRRLWSALSLSLQGDIATVVVAPPEQDLVETPKPAIEAHLVSIFEALLLDAVAERASDIHIELYGDQVRIRLRVDGELHDLEHYHLTPSELKGLVNVIKLRADLNIAERRLPQGGRLRLVVSDASYDLRVQVQPSLHSEHVVIRLLPQNSTLISIEKLGLSKVISENYRRLLRNPAGLVLVVGPTGSGKSTTLYAGLQLLASDGSRKVITIEDPIEYSINGIQQTRVRPEIGFHFSEAMRSFVRQDPDVIMVGEIRDQETAIEAIRASQTGHVVLSTLHCNDAVDAMQRLYDLKVHPNSLASELLAVIAQQLAKHICVHCKTPATPEPDIVAEVFPDGIPDGFRCYTGKGCTHCHGTGTHGRVAVVEYLHITPDIRNAISKQPAIGELRRLALDCGLITMRDSALEHVALGNIPLSELPRILTAERMAPEGRRQKPKKQRGGRPELKVTRVFWGNKS